jgi:hypothetical protein
MEWMLREGYQNEIMHEYTAFICAKTGDLLAGLRRPDPDERLLKGAGSILTALIRGRGGPSAGIEAYAEGAEATELYLTHLQTGDLNLQDLVDVSVIDKFLREETGEARDPALGWLERNETLLRLTSAVLSRPEWERSVREGIESEDQTTFWTATEGARSLGIDAWEIYFKRLKRGEDLWYYVMQADDQGRIEQVIQFALETLPLKEIASGPSHSLGLGPEYQHHRALDFVLQELRRFPGKGWPLIRAGLQSPTVRNRNMAVQALQSWERNTWPAEAEPLLTHAMELEPMDDTRAIMVNALSGECDETN